MRPDYMKQCTSKCEQRVRCTTCGKTKSPRGRSVPMEGYESWCHYDCPGYDGEPEAGHLWAGELAQYDSEAE